MTHKSGNRGSALLIATIMIMLVAGLSAIYLSVVHVRQTQSRGAHDGKISKSLAESATATFVNGLNNGDIAVPTEATIWPDAAYPGAVLDPTGAYYVLRHMGGGMMHVRAVPQATRLLVTGIGEYDGVLRTITVTTTLDSPPPLPDPGDAGAINVFGYPGQNIDFNYSITTGSGVAGGAGHPAMIIQDPDTMTAPDIVDFLADIENGVIDQTKFDGGLTAGYDANGDGITTQISVMNNPNLAVNQDTMSDFRTSLTNYVNNTWVPNANNTLGSFTQTTNTMLTYGSVANPQTTVINGDVNIFNGSLKGSGTLIIRGNLNVGTNTTTTTEMKTVKGVKTMVTTTDTTTGSFDWNGDVIIINDGVGASANFTVNAENSQSINMILNGGMYMITSGESAANFNMVSGNSKFQNGSIVAAISSDTTNSTMNITGGTVNMQGIFMQMGGTEANLKTSADPNSPNPGSLELNGSVFVGVRQDNGQVNVDLNDHMHIAYNQNFYENALDSLNQLISDVGTPPPPPTYRIESYAEDFNP